MIVAVGADGIQLRAGQVRGDGAWYVPPGKVACTAARVEHGQLYSAWPASVAQMRDTSSRAALRRTFALDQSRHDGRTV
jgi:hypothetical protein